MKKRILATIMTLCLMATLLVNFSPVAFAEDEPVGGPPIERTLEAHDYGEFIAALADAQSGEVITIGHK